MSTVRTGRPGRSTSQTCHPALLPSSQAPSPAASRLPSALKARAPPPTTSRWWSRWSPVATACAAARCSPAPSSARTPARHRPQRVGKLLLVDDGAGPDHQRLEDDPVPRTVTLVSVDGERAKNCDTHTIDCRPRSPGRQWRSCRRDTAAGRADTSQVDNGLNAASSGRRRSPRENAMNKSIGLIAAAILASTLTGCSIESDGAGSQISKPGSEVTEPAKKKWPRQPPCHVGLRCPVSRAALDRCGPREGLTLSPGSDHGDRFTYFGAYRTFPRHSGRGERRGSGLRGRASWTSGQNPREKNGTSSCCPVAPPAAPYRSG